MSRLWSDIRVYFRQFHAPVALACSVSRTAARIFDRASAPTYSQFGEDRILPLFMEGCRSPGFYVDVGANHPAKGSNTFWLYKRGWAGITIEPNQALCAEHRRMRPRDRQVQALVSNFEAEVEFIELENSLLSSASPEHLQQWRHASREVGRRKLKPRSLTSILAEADCPPDFDLLCVDTEGFDFAVLQSLDWAKYRPRLTLVEMADYAFGRPHAVVEFMAQKHYALKAFDGYNGYFQKGSGQPHQAGKGCA